MACPACECIEFKLVVRIDDQNKVILNAEGRMTVDAYCSTCGALCEASEAGYLYDAGDADIDRIFNTPDAPNA